MPFAVSIETHTAHITPLPEASHRSSVSKEVEGEGLVSPEDALGFVVNLASETSMRPAGKALGVCKGVQKAGSPKGHLRGHAGEQH